MQVCLFNFQVADVSAVNANGRVDRAHSLMIATFLERRF